MSNPRATGKIRQEESSPANRNREGTMKEKTNKVGQEIRTRTKLTQGNEITKLSKIGQNFLKIANQFESITSEQIKRKRKPRKKRRWYERSQ